MLDEARAAMERRDDAEGTDQYHPQLEQRCHLLSVTTASFMAFTHGANDISNAAGPLLAIWDVYVATDHFHTDSQISRKKAKKR